MDESTVMHPDSRILFNTKRKGTTKPCQVMGRLKCLLLRVKSQSEKAKNCAIPTLWRAGIGKTMEGKWLLGVGAKEG